MIFKNVLEKLFYVKSKFDNEKKYKCFNFFGVKFSFRVKYAKNLRHFIKHSRPCLLNYDSENTREKVYISIVAIFKDEVDIIDWIEHHLKIGVERFYLYDNDSIDDYESILKPYIDKGIVVYRKILGKCMQRPVYRDAICRYKNETEWLAIIDLDEYIVPVESDSIQEFLQPFEKFSGVVVNWVMYDSNGMKFRPNGKSVIEAYTRVDKDYQSQLNKTIKSIVKPKDVRLVPSVHCCIYKKGKYAVDENFERHVSHLRTCTERNSIEKIRVNHYHCKSYEDYILKISKGFADRKTLRKFNEQKLNFKNGINDFVAWKYLDK